MLQNRRHLLPQQGLAAGEQGGMEEDAQIPAVPPAAVMPEVELAGVDHQAVAGAEYHLLPVDGVCHHAVPDMDELQVVVPVARGAESRVGEQIALADPQADALAVVVDDLR